MVSGFGTLVIAVFGYGFALLCGIGTVMALRDFYRAAKRGLRSVMKDEIATFMVGVVLTIFTAAVTRWLVGGA